MKVVNASSYHYSHWIHQALFYQILAKLWRDSRVRMQKKCITWYFCINRRMPHEQKAILCVFHDYLHFRWKHLENRRTSCFCRIETREASKKKRMESWIVSNKKFGSTGIKIRVIKALIVILFVFSTVFANLVKKKTFYPSEEYLLDWQMQWKTQKMTIYFTQLRGYWAILLISVLSNFVHKLVCFFANFLFLHQIVVLKTIKNCLFTLSLWLQFLSVWTNSSAFSFPTFPTLFSQFLFGFLTLLLFILFVP